MSLMSQYRSFSENKPWTKRILLVFLILIMLLSLLRVSIPYVIQFGAVHWFKSQHIEASVGEVEISLLDGIFAINNVSAENKAGKGFSLGRFVVVWQWKPLFNHQAIINLFEIRSLNVDAAFFANGDMQIAGLEIKAAASEVTEDEAASTQVIPWDAVVKKISIDDVEFCVQQFSDTDKATLDYCGKLAALDWKGDAGFKPSIQSQSDDIPPVYVQGDLSINGIALLNNQLALHLLELGSINVSSISIETPENIAIDDISITAFSALQRAAKTMPGDAQVVAFDRLNIKPLKLAKLNDLSIGTIELIGSSAYLQINKEGGMDFAQWLPEKNESEKQQQETQAETQSAEAKPFHFVFNEFVFVSQQHFVFIDESLKETFTADVHNFDIRLTQLDSDKPEQNSQLTMALSIGEHGSFKLDTGVTPLSNRPSVKGKGEIAGLDLRMVAPMTKQYIGHNVKSGQLDADLKLDVEKGIIDSNMTLALHQFELESLSKEEAEQLNSEFGFPLNSSLSLIRDRDNTIRLDIPVTGDIDNPEFDPKDAIVKASSTAITAAVIQYYTPFGLVFAAEALFDLTTALDFDPVLFEAGETVLNATHKEQLDKLSALMIERPGIHLTLCGMSNNLDRAKIFPELVKADKITQQEKIEIKPVSKENLTVLKQLAGSRSANTKNYMVNEKKVNASRLIECSPEYMEDEIAAVEISI